MNIRLDGQVAIVTGAGQGLGRCHALALAERGAKVIVNDLGDENGVSAHADAVVGEITANGGEAFSHGANVANVEQVQDMVQQAMDKWGRIDILVNNAGILRDKTFAKMAMVGLMNTLHLEGAKKNIRVNCLAPTAGTAMTEGLIPPAVFKLLSAESVSPAVVFMAGPDAPSRKVIGAGGGSFSVFKGFETIGVNLLPDNVSAEGLASVWESMNDEAGMQEFTGGFEQTGKFAQQGAVSLGIDLDG